MGRPRILKDIICFACGKLFRPYGSKAKFCSMKCCYSKKPHRGEWFKCPICFKKFYRNPCRIKENKKHFCSRECSYKGKIIEGNKIELECKICKKRFKVFKSYLKIRNQFLCSNQCRGKWITKTKSGRNSPLWKGITPKLRRLRRSKKFRVWRESVFKRDNWTCQDCEKRGTYLEPHHIKEFAFYPKLRFKISNGLTLCRKCHNKTKKSYVNYVRED